MSPPSSLTHLPLSHLPHPSPLLPNLSSFFPHPSSLTPSFVTEKITLAKFCKILEKIVEDFEREKLFISLELNKIWIRIRMSMKSGIRIRIETFWIRPTGMYVYRCSSSSRDRLGIYAGGFRLFLGQCAVHCRVIMCCRRKHLRDSYVHIPNSKILK